MANTIKILSICLSSFKANLYTVDPFRMIGLIDVNIQYTYGIEKVTLGYFRSSGSNSGKIKGLWYPIVGVKLETGNFTEFTDYINYVLKNCTSEGQAKKGWLVKSLFFSNKIDESYQIRGFSNGHNYKALYEIGQFLRFLYEEGEYIQSNSLVAERMNEILISDKIYEGNKYSQRENFEKLIEDIFNEK